MLAAMSAKALAASAGSRLFGDDVLKRSPAKDRKNGVVQGEKREVAARAGGDARADAADHDRDREREEQQRQDQLARAARDRHRRDEAPDEADPYVGERDAGDGRGAEPGEEEREGRERDRLRGDEERKRRESLAEPDRASVARREDEPVEHAVLPLGDEGPPEAEERREQDRHPQEPVRREPRRRIRDREVEDDERGEDEEQHRGEGVSRPQLEPEILP